MLDRDDAPRLSFFVHDHALRASVGSAQIMYDQMISLLLLTAHPNFSINVVLAETEPNGVFDGSFMLMRYAKHAPTVAADTRTATLFLDQRGDTEEYAYVLDELANVGLEAEESRDFVDKLSREYGKAR